MNQSVSRIFLLCFFAAWSAGRIAAQGGDNVYRRMAVIAGASLQKSGIVELVSHELEESGAELVERNQIDALVREQILATTLGTDGPGTRVSFGRIVKADALVLLDEEGKGDRRRVRMVVAECRQGARLGGGAFPLSAGAARTAHDIAAQIMQTRQRFAGGVRGMIGVPAFLAKNFTYEYHALQAGYAVMLREALSELPGVAVVEVEEAQEIRNELSISGGRVNSVVPVFVEGAYEIIVAENKPAQVQLTIVCRTSDKSRTVEKRALSLDEAMKYVARDLAGEVMPDFRQLVARPFSSEKEFDNLVARAEQFALLGEWRHCADLRQAALVIHPQDVQQHEKLNHDCMAVMEGLATSLSFRTATPQWEQTAAGALPYYRAMLETTEWRVHHYREHCEGRPVTGEVAMLVDNLQPTSAGDAAQPMKRDFLLRVYPLTWDVQWITTHNLPEQQFHFAWADVLVSMALSTNHRPLVKEDYDLLLNLLNQVIPADVPASYRIENLLWGVDAPRQKGWTSAEFDDFVQRLGESKVPLNRILARVASLSRDLDRAMAIDADMLNEIEDLREQYLALNLAPVVGPRAGVIEELDRLKKVLTHPLDSGRPNLAAAPRHNPQLGLPIFRLPGEREIVLPPEPPPFIDTGALHLEQYSLRHVTDTGVISPGSSFQVSTFPGMADLVRCTDTLDLIWDAHKIFFMREPGLLESVFVSSSLDENLTDVQWDGRHIWVATRGKGLRALDTAGRIVATVGEAQGLPPCDQGARIAVLGNGRLIVAGSFGAARRAFLATLDKTDAGYQVRVFHKATRAMAERWVGNEVFDADLAFIPSALALCRSRDGKAFLVVRRGSSSQGALSHPLIVDLNTLGVAVSARQLPPYPFLAVADGLMQTVAQDEFVFWHPTANGQTFAADLPSVRIPHGHRNPHYGPNNPIWTVGPDGNVYLPGYSWYRIDPKTMSACTLAENGPPTGWIRIAWGRTGLILWGAVGANQNTMYSVRVDEAKAAPLEPETGGRSRLEH